MGVLYERYETEEHTIVRFGRYLPVFGGIMIVYFLLTFLVRNLWVSFFASVLVILLISVEMRPLNRELRAASDAGILTRSGRRMSFRNPLTYYIEKSPKKRPRKPKRKR